MTKAKARARAKARAAAKVLRPAEDKVERPQDKIRPGHFDAKANSQKIMGGSGNVNSAGAIRRGAARSR